MTHLHGCIHVQGFRRTMCSKGVCQAVRHCYAGLCGGPAHVKLLQGV